MSFGAGLLCLLGVILVPLVTALLAVGWYTTGRLEEKILTARVSTLEASISVLADQGFRRFASMQQALADSAVYAGRATLLADREAPGRQALIGMLQRNPSVTAGYVGFADGGFFYVTQLERLAPARRLEIGAPQGTVVAIRIIHRDDRDHRDHWTFQDDRGGMLGEASVTPGYDPRTRGWFQDAARSKEPILTEPYGFSGAGGTGITIATPLPVPI